jgi:L-2-hydroxyglutarate oxidase LhgO
MDSVDCVVVGAGVIGLAIARALALQGREVIILEAADAFGTGVSARSSEVIHAGIYYPRGSLKATLCVAGRELLYPFCARTGVEHRCCGKLIVATSDEQVEDLRMIHAAARDNGVALEWMSEATVRELEPELRCRAALFSPLTGIIDTHGYMQALLGEAESLGAILAVRNNVTRMWPETSAMLLAVNQGERPDLRANLVINSTGLHATQLAASIEGFPAKHIPRGYFARGHYFSTTGRAPFRHLIYPVPEPGGLGVHLTLDLAGQARFGPDVEWVDQLDYAFGLERADRFYTAIRRFWPALEDGKLVPAYAGIRPKISGPGEPAADFRIDGPAQHGVNSLINLFGIESPGITASLAIADHVAAMAPSR